MNVVYADHHSLDFLANEIDAFSGSHAWKVRERGVYYLDVKTSEYDSMME